MIRQASTTSFTSAGSSKSAAAKTTIKNVPKPLTWRIELDGTVEKKQDRTDRRTKAPTGA